MKLFKNLLYFSMLLLLFTSCEEKGTSISGELSNQKHANSNYLILCSTAQDFSSLWLFLTQTWCKTWNCFLIWFLTSLPLLNSLFISCQIMTLLRKATDMIRCHLVNKSVHAHKLCHMLFAVCSIIAIYKFQ